MKRLEKYMAGINLGGWISQYRALDHEHFKSFITESDFEKIASWGMDHVRIPVDYPVLEDDANPGVYLESGFAYLDNALVWAKKHNLNAVIDVHCAPGFSFGTPDKNTLFTDAGMQERFINLWKTIAKRYSAEKSNVMYELLNEIVEPDSSRWNLLAEKLIKAIREIDKDHAIVVGGIQYNSVHALSSLPVFDDENIVYNFHMYEPMALTHQRASWVKYLRSMTKPIVYPSDDIASYLEYSPPEFRSLKRMDKEFIRSFLKPAFDFIEKTGKLLYCGEYGVIDHADMASRENWTADLAGILLEYGIGRAVWSYKGMSFTHIDREGNPVSEKLIRAAGRCG